MTEPIDQATKDLIEKEAKAVAHKWKAIELRHIYKDGYIEGATVWAEKLKQERNKVIELYNVLNDIVYKYGDPMHGATNHVNKL